jgi:DDE_Tnp_1-like zinc-ribbon
MLYIAFVNSFLIWKELYPGRHTNLKSFLTDFVQLLAPETKNAVGEQRQRLHLVCAAEKVKRCEWCSANGRESKTKYYCTTCEVYLHPDQCFLQHHTQEK